LLGANRLGARGLALAAFAVLLAAPTMYGVYRANGLDAVAGYLRVGLVQPNMTPKDWQDPADKSRVAYLANMSNQLVDSWNGNRYRPDSSNILLPVSTASRDESTTPVGLIVWPQGALPHLGSRDRQLELVERLETWTDRINIGLLAGAETWTSGATQPVDASLFLAPHRAPALADHGRSVPIFDTPEQASGGFGVGQTNVAPILGFESLYGDHVRGVARDADVLVVLSQTDQWGHSPGVYQHLAYTRLRAIELRRAVVVSTVRGVSAVVHPDGESDRVAQWNDQGVASIDVPIYQQTTIYGRWGDWVGLLGLAIAIVGNVGLVTVQRWRRTSPAVARKRRR